MPDEQNIAHQGGAQDALSPLLEAVRRPIPGANPCGKDISYEDDFLSVKAEIDKMNAIGGQIDQERAAELRQLMDATRGTVRKSERTEAEKLLEQRASVVKQGAGPDYQFIRQAATRILSEKSKDIRIASYLCFALWQQDSFSGLADGIAAIEILVRDFWDGLFPGKNRPAARKSALDFLTTKLDESVAYAQVREADRGPLERARESLKSLEQQFLEKMPEGPPSLLGLSQAVDKCLNKTPRPAAATRPVTTEAPTSQGRPVGEAGPAAVPMPGELRTAQDAIAQIKQAAKFFREQNGKSPTPYRLLRSIRWDPIVAPPPNENGKSRLEAPPVQRRTFLTGLRENKNWTALLDECENSLGQPAFHLWLDMQRFTAEALEGLGPEFSAARIAAVSELTTFVQRVPKLPSLTFADGTPFADAATAAWIDESLLVVQASSGGTLQGPPGRQSNGKLDAQIEEAKHAFESGDLAGAIAILASPQADTSRKSFFRRKLVMAGFCMKGGQPGIARPLLEELEQDIDRFSLQEWEPSLALEAWTALTRCYETLSAGPATPAKQAIQQRGERVFERICRLDTAYALASAGVKPASKRPAPVPSISQGTPPASGNDNGTDANKEVTTQPQS